MHCFLLLSVDAILVSIATAMAVILSGPEPAAETLARAGQYAAIASATSIPVLLLFRLNRTVWRFTSLGDAGAIAAATTVIVALSLACYFSWDRLASLPRAMPVLQNLLILYALGAARIAMRVRYLRRQRLRHSQLWAAPHENVLVVGLNPTADLFLQCASESIRERVEVVGVLSNADRHHGRLLRSTRILGAPEAIQDVLHELSVHGVTIDRVVVAAPLGELSEKARSALRALESDAKLRIDCLSNRLAMADLDSGATHWDGPQKPAPERDRDFESDELPSVSYLRLKRIVDAVVALTFGVVFAPLMLLIFAIVRLDVGSPAIFWQQRPGAGGRQIRIFKFRTMRPARSPEGRVLSDAERLSMIGQFLRRMRLDELPQVYNVLLGHMSLVGPRPLLPIDQPKGSTARLRLRPGLTGWAQIKGGRHLSVEDKAALDLWYIKNASLKLDLLILAHTIRTVLFGERVDRHAIRRAWQGIGSKQPVRLLPEGSEQTAV